LARSLGEKPKRTRAIGHTDPSPEWRAITEFGYTRAETGKELVLVDVFIKNVERRQLPYNSFYFKLQDGSGNIRGPAFVIGVEELLGHGELAPGGEAGGWVPFQINRGDRNLMLVVSHPCFPLLR
jgi:uncharacterized protein DUF4352